MARIAEKAQNGYAQWNEEPRDDFLANSRNLFENLNARSALRDPLRNTADWPLRLLHVPSRMSSLRSPGSTSYDGVDCPIYNVLSYTWGRFAIATGPALSISNISWPIPPIDSEKHFTVSQFGHLVNSIADSNFIRKAENEWDSSDQAHEIPAGLGEVLQHLWLDVGCIDQGATIDSKTSRTEEIRKQMMIFGRAQTAYVWLSHHTTEQMADILTALTDVTFSAKVTLDVPEDALHQTPNDIYQAWLAEATTAIQRLLADPWFTSLWTFQEAFLRQDAILLSKEAQPVHLDPRLRQWLRERVKLRDSIVETDDYDLYSRAIYGSCWTVATLVAVFSYIHNSLMARLRHSSAVNTTPNEVQSSNLLEILKCSGIVHLASTNPFALYHATKFRKATKREDRINGCMQVFNVRLGHPATLFSSDASYDELNDELGIWLINRHGRSSQMFIHTSPAKLGKRWRFTLDCIVTDDFMPQMFRSYEMYLSFGAAKPNSWGISFLGIAYDFTTLAAEFSDPGIPEPCRTAIESRLCLDRPAIGALHVIALDESDILGEIPVAFKSLWLNKVDRSLLVAWLTRRMSDEDMRMLLLGHFIASTGLEYYCMGIIIVRQHDDEHGDFWARLGLCLWASNSVPLRGNCGDGKWQHLSGLYA
ncbi:MAG: hypothetical protein Q9168_004698 [Polycauliona sp. 1 TL-2023]